MTNKIGYSQYPNKEEFCSLYESMSQSELASYYQCNKLRIRNWIDYFGLKRRTRGGGNNRKYQIDKHTLQNLVDMNYSNRDIMTILKIDSISSVCSWLTKFGIHRKSVATEYQKYCRYVRHKTEKEYNKYKNEINPHNFDRTLCGVFGGYQLDHIKGVRECYNSGISIEECSSKENLQMIRWKDNLDKRIFHKYNKDNNNE